MKPVFDPDQLAAACGGQWSIRPLRPITGVIHDTRRLEPGDLFVPLAGTRDGHEFISVAFESGASAALAREEWNPGERRPLLRVREPIEALWAIAGWHRARLSFPVIGLTGSVGKTTVKEMVAAALEMEGPTVRTVLNWNNAIGLPLSLLKAVPGYHRFGVFEVGTNHPGEIQPLASLLRPDLAILTGIGPVHLEHFGTLDAIAQEKGALLEALPPDGVAVVNRDTPCFDRLRERISGRLVTVSVEARDAVWRVTCLERDDLGGQVIHVKGPVGEQTARIPRPGRHDALNAALALAAAVEMGVEWRSAAEGLGRGLGYLPMRWQQAMVGGIGIINDAYNANPISMASALETFAGQAIGAGRKYLMLGEMKELGTQRTAFHMEVGRQIAKGPWAGVVLLRSEGTEAMAEGALQAGFPRDGLYLAPDAEEAAATLCKLLRPGDWVLLKASRGVALERVALRLGFPGETKA